MGLGGRFLPLAAATLIGGASLLSAGLLPGAGVHLAAAAAGRDSVRASAPCQQILFVGARGSGEYGPGSDHWPQGRNPEDPHGLGGTVNSAYLRLVNDLGGRRTVQVVSVPYPAARVTTLLHDPPRYFRGIAAAVAWTDSHLTKQAVSCPGQRIVLAGFSEGAMVMHRVLHDLADTKADRQILSRLSAAVLAGDGDEVPNDSQQRFGTAALNARGVGQAFRTVSHTSKTKFSVNVGARVFSVCNRHDIVCGWTDTEISECLLLGKLCPIPVAAMVKIHLSYPGSAPLLAAADRAAAEAAGWDAVKPPSPAGVADGGQENFSGAACETATTCLAVGTYLLDTKGVNSAYPLVETAGSTSWTGAVTPLPGNTAQPPDASLTSVTCPSTTKCIAIGTYDDSAGNLEGLIVTGSGTHWTATEAPAPGNARGGGNGQVGLTGVACGSPTSCVITGGYLDDDIAIDGELLSEGKNGWSVTEEPLPADASETCSGICTRSGTVGVACPNPHACVVIGDYFPDGFRGLLLTGYGTHWTEVKAPDRVPPSSAPTYVTGIGCPAATQCDADGFDGVGAVIGTGYGSSWKLTATHVPVSAEYPVSNPVACVPQPACTIIGGEVAGPNNAAVAYLLTDAGSSWQFTTAPRPANASPLKDVTFGSALSSVTCPSAGECFAAGAYSAPQGIRPLLLSGSGSLWIPLEAPLPSAADSSGDAELTNVACASVTVCVATGFYVNSGGSIPRSGVLLSLAG